MTAKDSLIFYILFGGITQVFGVSAIIFAFWLGDRLRAPKASDTVTDPS